MASSVDNVYSAMPAVTGTLLRAPLGATAPTDAVTAPDAAFLDLGYIGEEGYVESNKRDTEKKKAFGGATVKILQKDFTATVKLSFLESTNAEVLKSVYGDDNVSIDGDDITIKKNKIMLPHSAWIMDTIDESVGLIRSYIPDGQVISLDDIKRVHTDTIMYTIEIECFENEDGDNIIEFIHLATAS
jgi:hypothetical protein